jgi:iron complex outermembrane receptor protein
MKLRQTKGTGRRPQLLGCTSLLVVATAGPAFAQDQATDAPAAGSALSEIVVTGTRVRGSAPVGSAMISMGRQDIDLSMAASTDRLIKEIPQVLDLGVSENSRGQPGGNGNIVYGNSVNLRGIGPYATLILVDGHRAISNSRSIDPSVLPTLGLERIEVVADGASAIYGSDAVAGVVNLIPRRNLDGVEMFARYGFADESGFDEYQAGAAFGKVWGSGQFMLAYEHVFRSNLSGDDRGFFTSDQTASGGSDYRVTRCNPGTIRVGAPPATTTYAIPAGGLTPANAGSLQAGTANRCEGSPGQDLFPEQEYDSVSATFNQSLNDRVELFADAFFSKRSFVRIPAHAAVTLAVPASNAFFVAPPGFAGTSYQLDYSFAEDLPPDTQTGFARSWQLTPGLRIELPADWQFEALVGYGRNRDESNSYFATNNAALTAALASSDPATAFDPYGLGRTSAATLAAIGNQIFLAPTVNRFTGYEARINGTLFELPGGALRLAAGYEGQEQKVGLGLARGNPGTPIVFRNFARQVDSMYAEVLVPIVGPGNARPGLQRLDLSAAVRYDDYSDVGDTTNPKFGITWAPVDGLSLRASYGTSFRAPLISQIYGNSNNLFVQSYQNPAGGAPLVGVANSGVNLDLRPEESTTWTIGFDWSPLPDVRLGLTWFDIEYVDQVETYLSDLTILLRESEFEGTGIILRGTAARDRVLELLAQGVTLARGSFPGGSPQNVTLLVDGRNNNLGRSNMQGLDFQGSWQLETARAGTFTFSLSGTWLDTYEVSITPAGTLVNRLDTIFQPLDFKARAGVSWKRGPWNARLRATHVGGYTNNAIVPNQSVSSYTPLDLGVGWQFDAEVTPLLSGLAIDAEIRDLFDEGPPYVNIAPSGNGSGGYDATAASPIGRSFMLSVRKSF